MNIRQATEQDFSAIRALYDQARVFFRENGINQWQKGYPEDEILYGDIAGGTSYVALERGKVVAAFVATPQKDPSYETIADGWWRLDQDYIAIHRVAVDNACKGRGIGSQLIAYVEHEIIGGKPCYLKADTHIDNHPMQRLLQKNGFRRAGVIRLACGSDRGAKRVAFDKIIK